MVTLKDVAREAGVSAQVVSVVVNGKAERARISPATRERVQALARELGYNPALNHGARQLAARRYGRRLPTNTVAVCIMPQADATPIPLHRRPFESEILDGIETAAQSHGLDVLQCRLHPARLPRLIEKGEVDGVIMLSGWPEHFAAIRRLHLPIIKIATSFPGCHSVSPQHQAGMALATSHLIEQGHRTIAFIGHATSLSSEESTLLAAARQRFAGYCAAMRQANLPVEYYDCSLRESFPAEGARAFQELWRQSAGRITAVVCYNDTMAMGVIQAARQLGLNVPAQLSVVGFDAVSTRYEFEPIVTSIGYDRAQMGARTVEILMQLRQAGAAGREKLIRNELPVYLAAGATTAPPEKA